MPKVKKGKLKFLFALLPIFAGLALFSIILFFVLNTGRTKQEEHFDEQAIDSINILQEKTDDYLHFTESVGLLFRSSERVERNEFKNFIEPVLSNLNFKTLEFVAWVPRAKESEKVIFKNRSWESGYAPFEITTSKIHQDNGGPYFFPIYFIEPQEEYKSIIGEDLASNSEISSIMSESEKSGKPEITITPWNLIKEDGAKFLFLILPLYYKNVSATSPQERSKALSGFIVTAFRIQQFFNDAFGKEFHTGIDLHFFSSTPTGEMEFSSTEMSENFPKHEHVRKKLILETSTELFGKPFLVKAYDTGAGVIISSQTLVWIAFVSGLLLAVLGVFSLLRTQKTSIEENRIALAQAVENSDQGIIVFNLDGKVDYINPAVSKILGYKDEELIGKSLLEMDFLSGGDEKVYKDVLLTISKGNSWGGQLSTRNKDGKTIYGVGSITPVLDLKGKIFAFVAIWKDVTADKARENQMQLSQKMEAVGRLAGGVAHDFNNILAVISGHSELMNMKFSQSPIKEHTDEIIHAVDRASALTRQLLTVSRRHEEAPHVVNTNEIIQGMEKMLGRLIGEDIELQISLPPDIWEIKADPSQIEQILLNLVVNAREAMPRGGKIRIETQNIYTDEGFEKIHPMAKPGPYIMITVSDTGIGMDKETITKIFEPFFTTKPQGTGMGLATVYGIIERSGGFLNVYSEPGLGATFSIYFPRSFEEGAKKSAPEKTLQPEELPRGTETILLVEDEKPVRDMIAKALSDLGYNILASGDPQEALRIAQENPGTINFLLTDVILPKMSGYDFADLVSKIRPTIKILYMSGFTNHVENLSKMAQKGDFIQKPFLILALAKKIRQIIDEAIPGVLAASTQSRKSS